MAIVFISPKKRQKIIILTIVGSVSAILLIIALLVFLMKPKTIPVEQAFHAPKISINFELLDSEKIKALQAFEEIKKEFIYEGKTAEGQIQAGKILAASSEEVVEYLKTLGLSEIRVEAAPVGRENPFVPYEKPEPKPIEQPKK